MPTRPEDALHPDAVALITALLLLVGLPVLSARSGIPESRVKEIAEARTAVYTSAGLTLVVLGVATFGVALWRDLPADELGWRVDGAAAAFAWAAAVAAGGLLLVWLSARVARLAGLEESPVSLALMPRTGREVRGFLLLAGAGAVAEEYLFRGYLQHVLAAWLGSPWIALAACSLSFGVSHGYQRAAGMARATLLGGLLTLPVVWTGSLFPAIVAHFWINAAVGTGGWRLLYPEEAEGRSAGGTGAGGAGHRAEEDGER